MDGIHLTGDFYGCKAKENLMNSDVVMEEVEKSIENSGMHCLNKSVHSFDGGGYTAFFLLAESHVSLHTWPELDTVNVDVYTCNYSNNNDDKAKMVFKKLKEIFGPDKITENVLKR